jgi:hypothetical protein
VSAIEGGRHFAHETIHLVLDLLMRLEPDVEIEKHLGEAGGGPIQLCVGHIMGIGRKNREIVEATSSAVMAGPAPPQRPGHACLCCPRARFGRP